MATYFDFLIDISLPYCLILSPDSMQSFRSSELILEFSLQETDEYEGIILSGIEAFSGS